MDVDIADPLRGEVPAGWDEFVATENLPASMNADVLTTVAWTSRRATRLAAVRAGGRVRAIVCGDIRPVRPRAEYVDPRAGLPVGIFSARMLIGISPGFHFAIDCAPDERRAIVHAFEAAFRRHARGRCLGFLYEKLADPASFRTRRSIVRATAPTTTLAVRWRSMPEYLQHLPPERRRRFRRLQRTIAAEPGVEQFVGPRVDAVQASRLTRLVLAKHAGTTPPAPLSPVYFERIADRPGTCFLGYERRDADQLLAFDLTLRWGERLLTTVHGALDPHDAGVRDLYFDLYLREIEYAIDNRLREVEFGPGMVALKAMFGARTERRVAVFRPL